MLHTKADSRSEVAPRLWSADPSDSSLAGEFPKWERWSWAMSSMGLAESELSKCRAGEYVSGQFIESNQVENWVFCSVNKNLDWVKQAGSRNIKSVQGGKFFFFHLQGCRGSTFERIWISVAKKLWPLSGCQGLKGAWCLGQWDQYSTIQVSVNKQC